MATWDGWESLGGQLDGGAPAVGINADGRLEVFASIYGASTTELGHIWQSTPGGGWSSWASFGSPPPEFLGFPAVATNADGRLEAFVRVGLMSSGSLWHIWQTAPNNGWSAWDNLDGGVGAHFVLVIANSDGRLEAFAITPTDTVSHAWQTAPNGAWSGWSDLGAPSGLSIGQLAVARNADGRLELFTPASDNTIWHTWQTATGGAWSGWASLGAPAGLGVGLPAPVVTSDGRLELFAIGGDQALWHIWQTAPGAGWSAWDSLGTPGGAPGFSTIGPPTIALNDDGRLEAFVVRYGDAVWHIWQTAPNNGWSAWDLLGGDPDGLAVARNTDGRLELFGEARATEGARQLWHRWQTSPGGAWSTSTQQWEQTPLAGPVHKLFTPFGGEILARTAAGLFRSDDNGSTWTGVNLPASPGLVAVANNPQTIYAAGSSSLQKTTDGGATWTSVLTTGTSPIIGLAISPADTNVVYVALGGGSYELRRSLNGGSTWTTLQGPLMGNLCTWTVNILKPHETDAHRAFRSSGCYAGRNVPTGDSLWQTTDQGATWTQVFHPMGLFPSRLAGGLGAGSQRYYLGAHVAASPGGGKLFRSDDDGATWAQILNFASGPSVQGLACHASLPQRVYAGLTTGVVQSSDNAGATWTDLGQSGLGGMEDLALSHNESMLFAATPSGVWRIPV
jgi:hypothetical protein